MTPSHNGTFRLSRFRTFTDAFRLSSSWTNFEFDFFFFSRFPMHFFTIFSECTSWLYSQWCAGQSRAYLLTPPTSLTDLEPTPMQGAPKNQPQKIASYNNKIIIITSYKNISSFKLFLLQFHQSDLSTWPAGESGQRGGGDGVLWQDGRPPPRPRSSHLRSLLSWHPGSQWPPSWWVCKLQQGRGYAPTHQASEPPETSKPSWN